MRYNVCDIYVGLCTSSTSVISSHFIDDRIKSAVKGHKLEQSVAALLQSGHSSTIKELAETVQRKLEADS